MYIGVVAAAIQIIEHVSAVRRGFGLVLRFCCVVLVLGPLLEYFESALSLLPFIHLKVVPRFRLYFWYRYRYRNTKASELNGMNMNASQALW